MKLNFLIFANLLLIPFLLPGQHPYTQEVPVELLKKVNSIESFFKRFNREDEFVKNKLIQSGTEESNHIKKMFLLTLFDRQKIDGTDGRYKTNALNFINNMVADSFNTKINFYDNHWYAEVVLDVIYKNEKKELNLFLAVEQPQPGAFHWAIQSVKADYLYSKLSGEDSLSILPPNSHGTDFINLPILLSGNGRKENYFSKNFYSDERNILLYAMNEKQIEFKNTRRIIYHFLQVDGWIFTVSENNKSTEFSGWTINHLIPATTGEKKIYTSKVINIH